jgi:hypothetical protein
MTLVRGLFVCRYGAALALAVAVVFAAGPAAAVPSGRWKGGDIDFRVKDDKVKKLTVTSVHTCQGIGTGEYWNELQTFAPPGKFKIQSNGEVSGQRIKATVAGTDYYDARFAMLGKFKGSKMTAVVQTSYKYWDYVTFDSPTNVSCFSEKKFSAKKA